MRFTDNRFCFILRAIKKLHQTNRLISSAKRVFKCVVNTSTNFKIDPFPSKKKRTLFLFLLLLELHFRGKLQSFRDRICAHIQSKRLTKLPIINGNETNRFWIDREREREKNKVNYWTLAHPSTTFLGLIYHLKLGFDKKIANWIPVSRWAQMRSIRFDDYVIKMHLNRKSHNIRVQFDSHIIIIVIIKMWNVHTRWLHLCNSSAWFMPFWWHSFAEMRIQIFNLFI